MPSPPSASEAAPDALPIGERDDAVVLRLVAALAELRGLDFFSCLDIGPGRNRADRWFERFEHAAGEKRYVAVDDRERVRSRLKKVGLDVRAPEDELGGEFDLTLMAGTLDGLEPDFAEELLELALDYTRKLIAVSVQNHESPAAEGERALQLPWRAPPPRRAIAWTPERLAEELAETFPTPDWSFEVFRGWPWTLRDEARNAEVTLHARVFALVWRTDEAGPAGPTGLSSPPRPQRRSEGGRRAAAGEAPVVVREPPADEADAAPEAAGPAEDTSAHLPADEQTPAPLLVVGTGGSGMSLLARIAVHAGRFMGEGQGDEPKDLEQFEFSWARRVISAGGWNMLPNRDKLIADFRAARDGFREPLAWAGRSWGWSHVPTIHLVPFYGALYPDLHVLHVVRDGRDAALGSDRSRQHVARMGDAVLGPPGEGEEAADAARQMRFWGRVNAECAAWCEKRMADRYLRVRLEDLAADVHAVAGRALAFAAPHDSADELIDGVVADVVLPESIGRWRDADPALIRRLTRPERRALSRFGYTD